MYNVRKVTDDLYWVGANDHRTHLFENIHPIPKGVSYNAYLLLDKETVLFDTVDWSVSRQMMENLEYLLGERSLDWLVINHLEPDHAASIDLILARWPKVKIISTEKGFMLMRQFGFHPDDHEIRIVVEGDTHCFGGHTVTFVAAPMVHWPEAMVTFDLTNGALFSADAFGSFIALDGKLFADEVNFDRDWIDEARRYLVNIVGKFGPHIQLLLKKAGGIVDQIKYICPLHGPVWRKDFGYFIDKYDKWSRYEPEEKGVLIAYASMYGNTEQMADHIGNLLGEKGIEVRTFDVSKTHVSYILNEIWKYKAVVLGTCAYNTKMHPMMEHLCNEIGLNEPKNKIWSLFGSSTWNGAGVKDLKKFAEEAKLEICGPIVEMTGGASPEKIERQAEELVAALIEKLK